MPRRAEGSVAEALLRLRRGDFVEVEWIDAAQVKNANIRRLPLPNHAVETRKISRGRFVCVQAGQTWRDEYVVLAVEKTDEAEEIVIIPVCLIKKVKHVEFKEPLKVRPKPKVAQGFSDGLVKVYR